MADSTTPVFPPELEEYIFIFAIQDDVKLVKDLSLVAKRVQPWIHPHNYKVIIYDHPEVPSYAPSPTLEDLSKHGKHVRHLMIRRSGPVIPDQFDLHIAQCPNLVSLGLWIDDDLYSRALAESIIELRIEYLSVDIEAFIDNFRWIGSPIPFQSITHLEHIGLAFNLDDLKTYFPSVTHISIGGLASTPISILVREVLLALGDQLKVVIWYLWGGSPDDKYKPSVLQTSKFTDIDDPRVVILRYGDDFVRTWNEGVRGELGIWKVAEEAIEARQNCG